MNDRAKVLWDMSELVQEALKNSGEERDRADIFTELIVRECALLFNPMLRDMISRGHAVSLIENHFGLLKAGQNMSDKGYSVGTKEGYDAFVEKRNAGNRSETLE